MIASISTSKTSFIERQFWLLSQHDKSSAYNVNSIFAFKNLDFSRFVTSVNAVINDVEILRSSYELVDGEIMRFDKFNQCSVIEKTFNKNLIEAKNWVNQNCNQEFDLVNEPLVRVIAAKFRDCEDLIVAISIHHIVIDLSAKDQIAKLISDAYNNFGQSTVSKEGKDRFNNYQFFSQYQSSWLTSDKGIKSASYWRKKLKNASTIKLNIPKIKSNEVSFKGGAIELDLPADSWQALKVFSKEYSLSPFVVLLTAYYLLLAKYSGESQFCIAVPLSNRKNPIFADTIGCFVNTLPITIEFTDKDTVFDVLKKVRVALLEAHRYQEFPSIEIIHDALKETANKNLYRHGFTFEHPMRLNLAGVTAEVIQYQPLNSQLDIFMRLWESDNQLNGHIEYGNTVFDSISAKCFADSFNVLVNSLLVDTDKLADSLNSISETNKLEINEFNNTNVVFEGELNLKSLFEKQVALTPNNIALIYKNES